MLLYPGLLVQMITTKQPTDDMIEVAIVSMEQALEADGETVPAGSGDFPRQPLVLDLPRRATARPHRPADVDRSAGPTHRPTRHPGR